MIDAEKVIAALTGLPRFSLGPFPLSAIWVVSFLTIQGAYGQNDQLVRLAKIDVTAVQLDKYKAALSEEIEASIRLEPGVLTLCAVTEKKQPTHVTIFETYASTDTYKAHLETPHFKKYKTGTMSMVSNLTLVQTNPIFFGKQQALKAIQGKDIVVQMTTMQVDPDQFDRYKASLKTSLETSVQTEPGVLLLYAVSEKENPTHMTVLEVYATQKAYQTHLKSPHVKTYRATTATMVESLELIEAVPILLGAKP